MLRRDHHVGGAEERVGPGGVDPQHLVARFPRPSRQSCGRPANLRIPSATACRLSSRQRADEEIDLRPGAPADPIPLQELDALGPVEPVEVFFQPVGIGGDPQHPLAQGDADDRMPAALAHSADDLLVGQHGAQGRAPIHRGFELIGQAMFVAVALDGRLRPRPPLRSGIGSSAIGRPRCWDSSNQVSNSTRKMHCVQRK